MIIKDKIYKFELYSNTEMAKPEKKMYSDSNDIYALEDVPKSCVIIKCFYRNLNEITNWKLEDFYLIGEEITTEEAKEEIEKISKIEITSGFSDVKEKTLAALQSFFNKKQTPKIYINKNVPLNEESIMDRIIISSWWSKTCIYISPKQIVNGKIHSLEQINSSKLNGDNSYIDLE